MDGVNREGRELRRLSREHRKKGGFPEWYRERAGRYAALRRGEGARWYAIASEVEVSTAALYRWMKAGIEGGKFDSQPVECAPEESWSSEQEVLRSLLRQHRKDGHLPKSVRHQLASYARSRRREGVTFRTIAQELGAAKSTVQNWCREGTKESTSGSLVPVIIEEPSAQTAKPLAVKPDKALVMVTPRGFRIEGLGLEELMNLLPVL